MLLRPSIQDLSEPLRAGAIEIASVLARAGHRAWIVGGAVRDLALSRQPTEIDMASGAPPEVVEASFTRTIAIGRNFGTLIVHLDGVDIEHTTFRSDSTYSDARRPDAVRFGASVAEDASRRDFSCNALFLDPLTDELADPVGGLADLEAGRLACVGDALQRFREDGLRIVRMARFAGGLELEPTPDTLAAARAAAESLRGVSRERVLRELQGLFARGGAPRALQLLEQCDVLDHVVPRLGELRDPGLEPVPWFERRLALYAAWPRACGLVLGLSGLLGPELAPAAPPHTELALELADGLRISRDLRRELASTWELAVAFRSNPDPARATRLRWMRRPGFLYALALARAWRIVTHARTSDLDALAAERAALSLDELDAAPWIAARDLEERNVPKGPLYGLVLAEAETLQLDRVLQSRADALAWLERRLQDGGNARRNA